MAILLRRQLVPLVVRATVCSAGIWLKLQAPQSSYLYLSSFHLPHRQRDDCDIVWHSTVTASRTWWNYHASSRTDYILQYGPACEFKRQGVNETITHVFGVDHALVHATASLLNPLPRARRAISTRCGKWSVDLARAVEACERRANEGPQHVTLHEFETLCRSVTFRPASFRYDDPPDVKALARERKRAPEDQRQELDKQVAALGRQRKQEWLSDVLLQARSGNYRAISYMRRRQSVGHVHSSYILSAGGEQQAVSDLRHFYA